MTTLDDINATVKSLATVVSDLYKQNEMRSKPEGEISSFLKTNLSGGSQTMFQEMVRSLGEKYANLKRITTKKDVLIHSMEQVILDLNGGKYPEEIVEYVNHYEDELAKHKAASKKHCIEKELHKHAVEVLECQHYVKDKLIDSHEAKIVDHKERLVDTHVQFTQEIDTKERQIYVLEQEVAKLKQQQGSGGVDPGFEKHVMTNAHQAVEECIDHYEELFERISKENLDKDTELANHKWAIEQHETDHFNKDRRLLKQGERFEEHSQSLKETVMHLQMEVHHKDLIIQQMKNTATQGLKSITGGLKDAGNVDDIKRQVEIEMEKLNQLVSS